MCAEILISGDVAIGCKRGMPPPRAPHPTRHVCCQPIRRLAVSELDALAVAELDRSCPPRRHLAGYRVGSTLSTWRTAGCPPR